jgi:hypothetical protein
MRRLSILAPLCLLLFAPLARGDEPSPEKAKLYKQLEERLTRTKWTGNFTVTGKELGKLTPEEYTILSAMKAEQGEMWLLTARVKYGGKDVTLPMPIEILWAGSTPIITLEKATLPGLGTFSARVVLHDDKYAGTWQHDKVGGHLFGTIEKLKDEKDGDKEKPVEKKEEK